MHRYTDQLDKNCLIKQYWHINFIRPQSHSQRPARNCSETIVRWLAGWYCGGWRLSAVSGWNQLQKRCCTKSLVLIAPVTNNLREHVFFSSDQMLDHGSLTQCFEFVRVHDVFLNLCVLLCLDWELCIISLHSLVYLSMILVLISFSEKFPFSRPVLSSLICSCCVPQVFPLPLWPSYVYMSQSSFVICCDLLYPSCCASRFVCVCVFLI